MEKTPLGKTVTCYGQIRTGASVQEWYETTSRDAGRRAKTLRKAGFCVLVSAMGSQITSVGHANMTLLTVLSSADLPAVKVERMS